MEEETERLLRAGRPGRLPWLLKEKKKRWYGVKDLKGSGIAKLWKVGEIRDERVKNDHDTL